MPNARTPSIPSAEPLVPPRQRIPRPRAASDPQGVRAARLKLWPLEAGRYGLDVTFHGHWACEDAEHQAAKLSRRGMTSAIRSEADGGWTVRLGPLGSLDVARALKHLVS